MQGLQELVNTIIEEKLKANKDIVKIGFYEIRVKHNLTETEAFEFILQARKILENIDYDVYLTNAKYEYKGKKYIVQDNELMVAIKE